MEKRTLLAVVLSALTLFAYYYLFPIKAPQRPESQTQQAQKTSQGSEAQIPPSTGGTNVAANQNPEKTGSGENSQNNTISPEQRAPVKVSTLKTEKANAQLTSQTGLLSTWELSEFFQNANNKGPHINLLEGSAAQPTLELFLFSNQTPIQPYFEETQKTQNSVQYRGVQQGLELEESLQALAQDYALEIKLKIKNVSDSAKELRPGLRLSTKQMEKDKGGGFLNFLKRQTFITPVYLTSAGVTRHHALDKIGQYTEETGDISWVGLEDQYFLRAIIAESSTGENLLAYGKEGAYIFSDFRYPKESLNPGEEKTYRFQLFLGPKNPTYLNAFSEIGLNKAIDYGWLAVIARPILWLLKFFESFLGNWGLAIILLTVFIKLLLHPLTKKSMQSMKAMQKLQPKLKELREKFKNDRERLNIETMNLFKTHKVNPMGGCLPMLLQMPIYFALYKVLYTATELYHAPFFGPYRDLSAPDPYFILPILLGGMMVLQQKLTPNAGDPAQAKMMMLMPVMFSVFMLFLPIGLVLYIFVNTLMTVIQQYMHHRDLTFWELFKGRKPATS